MVKIFQLLGLLLVAAISSCGHSDGPLYRIQENGLYGFIDSTGVVAIQPQYKYVSSFNLYGYATVITEYSLKIQKDAYGSIDTLLCLKYGMIDKDNSIVVDTTQTMELVLTQMQQLDLHQIYKKFTKKFVENDLSFNDRIDGGAIQLRAGQYQVQDPRTKLMGYANLEGDTIIKAKYKACMPFYKGIASVSKPRESFPKDESFIEGLNAVVLIDSLGKELTQTRYFMIPHFTGKDVTWACKVVEDEGNFDMVWLALDDKGKVCSDTIRNARIYNANSDYYIWQFNLFGTQVYSFVNRKGKWMTDYDNDGSVEFFKETFNDVTSFTDTIAGVRVNYGEDPCWTFVNQKFEFISQPFDSVGLYNEGIVAVKEFSQDKKTTKWGFVDRKFKEVIPYKYDKVGTFVEGLAYFKVGNIEGYINKTGKVVWSHTTN